MSNLSPVGDGESSQVCEEDEMNVPTLRLKAELRCSIPVLRGDEVGLLPLIANCSQVSRDALQVVISRSFTGLRGQPARHSSGALAGEIDFRDQGVAEEDQDPIFESFDGDVLSCESAADMPRSIVHVDVP